MGFWDKKLGQPQQPQPVQQRPATPPVGLPGVWTPNTPPPQPVQFQAPPQALPPQQMPRPQQVPERWTGTDPSELRQWLRESPGGEGVMSGQITPCPKCGGDVIGSAEDKHAHCFYCGYNGRFVHTLPPAPTTN